MSFQDDSQILSRLGILESTEESPRKSAHQSPRRNRIKERERFVEVNIDGEETSESEDDEDPIFDQDTLLSAPSRHRVLRKRAESFTCRYIVLLATYFALGLSFHSSPDVLYSNNRNHSYYTWNVLGTVIGLVLGKLLILRVSSIFLSFLPVATLTSLTVLFYVYPLVPNIDLVCVIQGSSIGICYYVGLCTWFSIWRSHTRKMLFVYTLLALGAGVAILSRNDDMVANALPRPLAKREVDGIISMPLNSVDMSESDGAAVVTRPKKPQVAQGINSMDSKTKENEEMRIKVAENKANETDAVDSSNSTEILGSSSASVETTTSLPETTTSTTSTTTTTTTPTTTTLSAITNEVPSETREITKPTSDSIDVVDSSVVIVALSVLCTTTALYCIGFTCCCLKSKLAADPKMLKMSDATLPGLSSGCKLRLSLFQLLCGAAESIIMMTAFHGMVMYMACGSVLAVRIVAVFLGSTAFSLTTMGISVLVSLLSAVALTISPTSSFSMGAIAGVVGIMGPLTLLFIESRLSPRPSVLIDLFLFPQQIGRLLAALLCQLTPASSLVTSLLIVILSMTVVFCALIRSVSKAARLKEIMEYSSQPVPDAVGEYFSLLERDGMSSGEDEPLVHMDEV